MEVSVWLLSSQNGFIHLGTFVTLMGSHDEAVRTCEGWKVIGHPGGSNKGDATGGHKCGFPEIPSGDVKIANWKITNP